MAARALDEIAHDLFAKAGALMARQNRDVADVRAVETIGQRTTGGNQATIFVHEALEHAVGEDRLEMQRLLVTQRSYPIERRELFPIDSVSGVLPFERHEFPLWDA